MSLAFVGLGAFMSAALLGPSPKVHFLAGVPQTARSSSPEDMPVLSPDYREMVRLYASGERDAALALLAGWTEGRVRHHSLVLSGAVVSIRKCPTCEAGQEFSGFPIRAALLLHADREIQEQFSSPPREQPPRCGRGTNAAIIDSLARIHLLTDAKARDFLKLLHLGMARHAQWSHCFPQSQQWARAGLEFSPRDPLLLMALGIALESSAFFTLAPAPHTDLPGPAGRERDDAEASLRGRWKSARRAFEEVVAASPDLMEGRLRLGRVLWRLGDPDAARACFETVLRSSAEANLQYLAHLFLGRVLEDQRKWSDAEEHYQAARAMEPLSETAAVALSHIRFLQGDTGSARVVLRDGLEAARRRTTFDPWVPYSITQTPDGERILAGLRQAVRQ